MPTTASNYAPLIVSHTRLHERLSHQTAVALAPTIRHAARAAARELIRQTDPFMASLAIQRSQGQFERVMQPHWRRIIQAGVDFERVAAEQGGLLQAWRPQGIAEPSLAFLSGVAGWMRDRSIVAWRRASQWIMRRLWRVRSKTLTDNQPLGPPLMESANAMGFIARLMALMEVTYGLNSGGQFVRIELGIGSKIWLSVIDDHTRRGARFNHVLPHGQVQRVEMPFVLSGDLLMFPGDASLGAPLGQLAGCRCLAIGTAFRN